MNVEQKIMADTVSEVRIPSGSKLTSTGLGPKPVIPEKPQTVSLSGQAEGANASLLRAEQERARQAHIKSLESVYGKGNVGGVITQKEKFQAKQEERMKSRGRFTKETIPDEVNVAAPIAAEQDDANRAGADGHLKGREKTLRRLVASRGGGNRAAAGNGLSGGSTGGNGAGDRLPGPNGDGQEEFVGEEKVSEGGNEDVLSKGYAERVRKAIEAEVAELTEAVQPDLGRVEGEANSPWPQIDSPIIEEPSASVEPPVPVEPTEPAPAKTDYSTLPLDHLKSSINALLGSEDPALREMVGELMRREAAADRPQVPLSQEERRARFTDLQTQYENETDSDRRAILHGELQQMFDDALAEAESPEEASAAEKRQARRVFLGVVGHRAAGLAAGTSESDDARQARIREKMQRVRTEFSGAAQPPPVAEGAVRTIAVVDKESPADGLEIAESAEDTTEEATAPKKRPSIVPIVQAKPVSGIAPDGSVPYPNITSALASRKESWLSRLWPFGKKSAGTTYSQKPYSATLGEAADDLAKFRDSLGQNRADVGTLPKPATQRESKHIGRKLARAGALAAVLSLTSDQQSLGPTNIIPEPKGGAPEGYVVPPPHAEAPISEVEIIEANAVAGGSIGTSTPAETPVAPTPPLTSEPTESLPATAKAPEVLTQRQELEQFVETKTKEVVIERGSSISDAMERAGIMSADEFNEQIYTKPDAALGAFILAYPELVAANPNIPPLYEIVVRYNSLSDSERLTMLKEFADLVKRGHLDLVYPTEDTENVTGPSLTVPASGKAAEEIANMAIEAAKKSPEAFQTFDLELREIIKAKEDGVIL